MEKEKKKKEPKRKPKYGLFSSVAYIYRILWQTERGLAFTGLFTVPVTVVLSALSLYTPSAVLRALSSQKDFSYVAQVILGLLLAKLCFDLANTVIWQKISGAEHLVLMQLIYMYNYYQRMRDDYLSYDVQMMKLDERGNAAIRDNHTAGVHFPMDFANLAGTILNFILFGSVISLLNPVIVLLLLAGSAINYAVGAWERRKNWETQDIRNKLDKKIKYTTLGISNNFCWAKDIRLYHMQDGLHERFMRLYGMAKSEKWKCERRSVLAAIVGFLIVLVRDGAAYGFLIGKVAAGELTAASFVLYFSAITSMSGLMGRILWTINRVLDGALEVSDFREGLETDGKLNHGKGIPVPKKAFSIEFRHVSFRYPKGEKKVLDDVSFTIKAGEKVALVGVNGAGKTTLTRLMCGLLLPDEGEILLDGHTLYEYNRDEMYTLFGLIPQSYSILPCSIAKNIACVGEDEEIDSKRLWKSIEQAGLAEKIAALPLGVNTPLGRELSNDGIELSGGETQKLLLARLLYKNPLFLILDEPTAALDPIAEDRVYHQYGEITKETTSVFISHRLASTRFCDRIFLLDGANFAEVGTHEELMAAGGKYRELFDVQSKYYKKEAV
jgi:ABC-type multidrug transport system fused ATPase/permease subunit